MPHEPTSACDADHCYWHNEDEPQTGVGDGVLCGECLHWFPSAEALIEADRQTRAGLGLGDEARPASDIWVCPLCAHNL